VKIVILSVSLEKKLSVSIKNKSRIVIHGFRKILKNDAEKMIPLQEKKSDSFVPTSVNVNANINHPQRRRCQRLCNLTTEENVKIVTFFVSIINILSVSIKNKSRIVIHGFRKILENDAEKMIPLQGKKSDSFVPTFVNLNADLNWQ
jgi:hypothetical protein